MLRSRSAGSDSPTGAPNVLTCRRRFHRSVDARTVEWNAYTPGLSQRVSSTSTFFHGGIKNTDTQTNPSKSATATRVYDAFGNIPSSTGTWSSPFGYAGPFGYQEDNDSGLKLLGHRYYDSSTGRFLSRDPAQDGRNWYVYSCSMPLIASDPLGLGWRRVVCGILGGIAGGILGAGNPAAIAAGVAIGGGLGDAADQAAQNGDVNWGQAGLHGVTDGLIGLASGYCLSWLAKAIMPLEEGAGGMIQGLHLTTKAGSDGIAESGIINPGRGGNVWGWPKPVPPLVNRLVGGRGSFIVPFEVAPDSFTQGWWGQIIHHGPIKIR